MYDQFIDSLRKAAEAGMQMQQETYQKWLSLWPVGPTPAPQWQDQMRRFQEVQKKWTESVKELVECQKEMIEVPFEVGRQNIEKIFQIGEGKTFEEMRTRAFEFWQKCFEGVGQVFEERMKESRAMTEKFFRSLTPTVT